MSTIEAMLVGAVLTLLLVAAVWAVYVIFSDRVTVKDEIVSLNKWHDREAERLSNLIIQVAKLADALGYEYVEHHAYGEFKKKQEAE